MLRDWLEYLGEFRLARWIAGILLLTRGWFRLARGHEFQGIDDFCWVERVSKAAPLRRLAQRVLFKRIAAMKSGANPLIAAFRRDPSSIDCASIYTVYGANGKNDLFRDLIVLKRATATEKGVILLKYARTFSAVAALMDLSKLMSRYTFVLEPCWAGYCDPSLLMFISGDNPTVVQCFTDEDFKFVSAVGYPLIPVRLGPADWVDANVFKAQAATQKKFDLVMVANWGAHKRHKQLFRALSRIRDRKIHVLLVGFPWARRTSKHIRREAARYANDCVELTIMEKVPQRELAVYVAQSRAYVFLSRKEGDNKALVEAMFAGLPAIVYDKSVGGAVGRINAATGVLASDEELSTKIVYVLDHLDQFAPRQWAIEHTGSEVATSVLNETIRQAMLNRGSTYTVDIVEKTNSPNLAYKDQAVRKDFAPDYEFVLSCVNNTAAASNALRV